MRKEPKIKVVKSHSSCWTVLEAFSIKMKKSLPIIAVKHLYRTFLLISHFIILGYPNREEEYYNEQEYQYDYDDDKVEYSEENRREEISFRPQIVSDPVKLDVDNGMTIRLPCLVDKLPGEIEHLQVSLSLSSHKALKSSGIKSKFEVRKSDGKVLILKYFRKF